MYDLFASVPWPLLALAPLAWLLPRSEVWSGPWRSRLDLPLIAAAGLGGAIMLGWTFGPRFTVEYPLSSSDFDHYCELVGAYARHLDVDFNSPRSRVAAALPALLARRMGIIPALACFSLASVGLLAAAAYLWGMSVHGRTAGLLAVLLLGAVAPVGVLARDVSFYPFIGACNVLAAAGTAATFRFRGAAAPALAGVALALCPLADVRGVLWAVALLPVALLGTLLSARSGRAALAGLALLLAPLALSFAIAHRVVPVETPGLSNQAWHYVEEGLVHAGAQRGWALSQQRVGYPPSGFLWGHSGPAELATTLRYLGDLSASVPPEVRDHARRQPGFVAQVQPWVPMLCVALLAAAGGLARRPRMFLAMAGTVAPFLVMLWNAASVLPQARYLSTSMVAIPLVLAVALAALVDAPVALAPRLRLPTWLPARAALAIGVTALALAGIPPSWIGLDADWRQNQVGQSEPRMTVLAVERGSIERPSRCTALLARDRAEGRALRTPLYGYPEEPGP